MRVTSSSAQNALEALAKPAQLRRKRSRNKWVQGPTTKLRKRTLLVQAKARKDLIQRNKICRSLHFLNPLYNSRKRLEAKFFKARCIVKPITPLQHKGICQDHFGRPTVNQRLDRFLHIKVSRRTILPRTHVFSCHCKVQACKASGCLHGSIPLQDKVLINGLNPSRTRMMFQFRLFVNSLVHLTAPLNQRSSFPYWLGV